MVDASGLAGSLGVAILVGMAFAAFMLSAGYGLKITEIVRLAEKALQPFRFRRTKPNSGQPKS
jgi:hypothetical protein